MSLRPGSASLPLLGSFSLEVVDCCPFLTEAGLVDLTILELEVSRQVISFQHVASLSRLMILVQYEVVDR